MDEVKKENLSGILRHSPIPNRSNCRVHFQPPNNLKTLLSKYANNEECYDEIQGFMTHAQNLQGHALITWIEELQENIPLLNNKLEGFVQALFKVSWASQEPDVAEAFKNFLINLLSAHSYYMKDIINSLVANFLVTQEQIHSNTHQVLEVILLTCPLNSKKLLLSSLKHNMPYILTPAFETHEIYMVNLLRVIEYAKDIRLEILQLLIQRAIELDVRIPKNAIEEEEENEDPQFDFDDSVSTISASKIGTPENSLERARINMEKMMATLFKYIDGVTSEGDIKEKGKEVFIDFLTIFESHILPTWATEHVQFIMFYFVNKDPYYVNLFLSLLWKKFQNPNSPSISRQSAVTYIASLISRGKFIPLKMAKLYLEKIVLWIHAYIKNSDFINKDFMYSDIKAHGPFYASVQSAFYMFAFRHEEFVENKKDIEFLKSLNFNTIVTSPLNPLRVCLPPVVKNFASISRNYQLAYCDTIIQRNNRINLPIVGSLSEIKSNAKPLLLDSFFPFDPYSMKETASFIEPLYREYTGGGDDESGSESEDEEQQLHQEEEEDMEIGSFRGLSSFGYGTSPGFKMI